MLRDNRINAPEPAHPPSAVRQWLSDNAQAGKKRLFLILTIHGSDDGGTLS